MRLAIPFLLPDNAKNAERILARLAELTELINLEKEEQAIEPAFFKGNLSDYPDWFDAMFEEKAARARLEIYCRCEPGDLDGWDLESWYDDFFASPSFDFAVQADDTVSDGQILSFHVERRDYGGDTSHAWLLLAAGAETLGPVREIESSD